MPWHKEMHHSACPTDRPIAVVKDSDGSVEGCHATEADADDQLAALYASEGGEATVMPTVDFGGRPNKGTPKDKRLRRNKQQVSAADLEFPVESPDYTWTGTLAVEGTPTGDGREFAPEALTWAEPPLPLRWNKEDSHGGEPHTVAVLVGRIDKVWRDGNSIMGSGVFNPDTDDGMTAYNLVKDKFLKGVSIDADDITGADVEYVWPEAESASSTEDEEDGDGDDLDIIGLLFGMPEKVIFHGGRIRAATLCDIPAFVEAYITTGEGTAVTPPESVTAAAVGSHQTATADGPWDAGANEKRLPSPMPMAKARAAYAWIAPGVSGECNKTDAKFIHHEVSADGAVGAANLTACSSGVGILHGGRGGTNIPETDRRGVYNHLAAHLRSGGQEPPPFNVDDNLVAHAAHDDWKPPKSWFADPQFTVPVPITVTDEGRVYGHAAQWGQCHLGYNETCVTPPHEDDFPYFMTGEVVADDGSRVSVGQITVNTRHAPIYLGASSATEHYENTGLAVADIVVGNDGYGIWVAGAVRPDAEMAYIRALRGSGQLSGDWRRIGGKLRLVALLAVNTPGFPVPRLRARLVQNEAQALVAAGHLRVHRGPTEEELNQRALRILADNIMASVGRKE